jgi:hypothetical protein
VLLRDGPRPFDVYCLPVGQYGGALETLRYASFSECSTTSIRSGSGSNGSPSAAGLYEDGRKQARQGARKLVLRTQELKAAGTGRS